MLKHIRNPRFFFLIGFVLHSGACVLSEETTSESSETAYVHEPSQEPLSEYLHGDAEVFFHKYPYLQAPQTDGMTVVWHVDEEIPGRVKVWDRDGKLVLEQESVPEVVDVSWFTVIPLAPVPGFVHTTVLKGLEPGQRYSYQVQMGNRVLRTAEFMTIPLADMPFRIGLVGDNRTIDIDHQSVVDALALTSPDVVVNTGDMTGGGMVQEYWDAFFAIEGELLSNAPLLPVYGNHEHNLGEAYYAGFFRVSNDFERKRNYSLRYGNVHLLMIDSNLSFELEGEQKDWIIDELKSAKDADYLFVFFHHPFYSFSKHIPRVATREVFHPIFVEHEVTAVFNGHNHCYEHFLVDGIHYIVTGGGGAPLYASDSHIVESELHLRKVGLSVLHYSVLDVRPEAIRVSVTSVPNGEQIDVFSFYPRANQD